MSDPPYNANFLGRKKEVGRSIERHQQNLWGNVTLSTATAMCQHITLTSTSSLNHECLNRTNSTSAQASTLSVQESDKQSAGQAAQTRVKKQKCGSRNQRRAEWERDE